MVKFNWWELKGYFGKHPKRFKKKANKQIRDNILLFLKDIKMGAWTTQEEIFEATLEKTDLFNSPEGKMFFAQKGVQSKIGWAVNELRRLGRPIISGKGKRGYRYADENTKDFIEDWNEKVNAWLERKSNLTSEFKVDKVLMERIIEKLEQEKRLKEAQRMKEVLVRYSKERKKIKNEDEEEE